MSTRTESLAFRPDARVLAHAIDELEELGAAGGGAVDVATRRAALLRYERFVRERHAYPPRWRHDYAALRFDDLVWSSGRALVPARPRVPGRANGAGGDVPSLAVANAGGIVHLGSTYLQPQVDRGDARVELAALADAVRHRPAVVAAILGAIVPEDDPFVALATAFGNCGAYVDVPAGVALDAPIQLVWAASPGATAAVFARTVVRVGAGASATIVERHVGDREAFVAATVEIELGPRARLDYVVVQEADDGTRLFVRRGARCGDAASVAFHVADLGGALARTALDVRLDAPHASGAVHAFSFARAFAHADLLVTCAHRARATVSRTVVRRAASDRGQGRFFGTVAIDPATSRCDATMRDDALVLSRDAYLQSDPRLSVRAADVSVAHAASVGSLADDALFYVQSRGIARGRAEKMMALAFFEPAIARFPGDDLRDEVRAALDERLDRIGDTFAS